MVLLPRQGGVCAAKGALLCPRVILMDQHAHLLPTVKHQPCRWFTPPEDVVLGVVAGGHQPAPTMGVMDLNAPTMGVVDLNPSSSVSIRRG